MASQAEVDLVVNATRTLPQLERDLDRVLNAAQADMSDLDVDAVLRSAQSLNDMERDLDRIIRQATDDADPVTIAAAINQRDSLRDLQRDLDAVVTAVNNDGSADAITVLAALNVPDAIADLHDDVVAVVRAVQATAPDVDIDVDIDRNRLRSLITNLGSATSVVSKLTGSVVGLSVASGAVAPLLASVATAVQNILPAAAVATTGILAVTLATQTLKLGMMGVGDAIKDAFAADADMAEVEKALKRLAPSARATAREIIKLKPAFKDLQLDVQQALFKGFAGEVKGLSTTVLPDVRRSLLDTAATLNAMGRGAAQAGQALSDSGVLGQALKSATNGLDDLKNIPAQVIVAFGQLAAAAGPSFERITTAVAGVADRVSKSLAGAFKSGALEGAIDDAIDAIAQLGRSFGNVFAGIGNVIDAVSTGGEGLFATFERVSQAFEDLTADKGFQDGLRALADVASTVSKTVLPLLAQALKIVAGVLVELSEPVKRLVATLGENLTKILSALGPVLIAAAGAFGLLLNALGPIIDLAGELISGILPILTPLFDGLGRTFVAMAPFIQQVAEILGSILTPILAALPAFLEAVIEPFVEMAEKLFPQVAEQLAKMAPDFAALGVQLGLLLVALTPIALEFGNFIALVSEKVLPVITGALIGTLALLAKGLTFLAKVFTDIVIPVIQTFIDILQGDFANGNAAAIANVRNLRDRVGGFFGEMAANVRAKLSEYVATLQQKVQDGKTRFLAGILDMRSQAVAYVAAIPDRIRGSLGNLSGLLQGAGQEIINGLILGIQSKIGEAIGIAKSAADAVKNSVKGALGINSPSKVMAELGVNTIEGFVIGLQKAMPRLRSELTGMALSVPSLAASSPSALSTPAAGSMAAPAVYVSIGGEAIDQYVTVRSERVYNRNARTAAQGVRN